MDEKKNIDHDKLPGLIAIVLVAIYLLLHLVDGLEEIAVFLKPHIVSVLSDLISSWGSANG